ncbi:RelA/SpoT family protein [Specibacter sp. NPDC057265]|uniref:RelA/SpoT family protein n=1 Tax=Specibacter sp. NPDC057265 TaxID=3346075 RepID=UPI0036384FD2
MREGGSAVAGESTSRGSAGGGTGQSVASPAQTEVQTQDPRPTFPGRRERTRSRLARLTGWSTESHSPILEPLLRIVRARNPKEDFDLIQRAFVVAEKYHEGQKRKSGDPYITHPVAVATILAEMGMSGSTLAAALLHDTVEDTAYTLAELERDFSAEIRVLVDGVTKLDKVEFGDAAQAETVRKMVIAMAQDIRVLVIKLADRLHNARTWRFVSAASSGKKARETLDIFAPLAHRLGMNAVKWELEELSFAALYPKVYEEIVRMVQDRSPEREKQLSIIRRDIAEVLRTSKIKADITGRPKHYYSIYQKMVVRNKDFDDINDLIGVRVVVDTVGDCYAALGQIHSLWSPLVGRFKDYIALPKFNMYQSLHTTVVGPGGKLVEIQIRTLEMHRRAEYGVAAHWKYKSGNKNPVGVQEDMNWLRSLLDWQQETSDSNEFLDSLRYEMNSKEVYVYTPKGKIIALPEGATPVDFAYSVHTEVGNRTIGARVNGKLVPLNSELSHGDTVEIFTNKAEGAGPSQDWQNFVKSARARNKIRQWFTKERRDESIEKGKDLLTKAMRKQNLPLQKMMTHDGLLAVTEHFHYVDIAGLYAAVGDGHTSAQSVVEKLRDVLGVSDDLEDTAVPADTHLSNARSRISESGVIVHGMGDVLVKLARCCTPVPPDPISGFVTKGSGISVHRQDCPNFKHMESEPGRLVDVEWAPTQSGVFLVEIQVEALDRKSLLSDVTRVLAETHVNILAASVNTSRDRMAISKFAFEMGDPKYLDHVLNAIRRIDGVFDVYRSTGSHRRA